MEIYFPRSVSQPGLLHDRDTCAGPASAGRAPDAPHGGRMIDVTAAIWIENGRVLIARRRPEASQAGMWEFPGGKVQTGESPEQCLKREIEEELGIRVEVGEFFGESIYAYVDKTIRLLAYRVRSASGQPSANDHAELAWVKMADLRRFCFCPADVPFVEKLGKTA